MPEKYYCHNCGFRFESVKSCPRCGEVVRKAVDYIIQCQSCFKDLLTSESTDCLGWKICSDCSNSITETLNRS